jgi:prevent-host-death family protein
LPVHGRLVCLPARQPEQCVRGIFVIVPDAAPCPCSTSLPIRLPVGTEVSQGNVIHHGTHRRAAKERLSELVDRALEGEEIVIARAGKPAVRLVPIREGVAPREGGQWKGSVSIAEGFDELPEDLARAFGAEPPGPDLCLMSACRRRFRRRE